MRKLLSVLSLLPLSLLSLTVTGCLLTHEEFHSNGKLKERGSVAMFSGTQEGEWTFHHLNGQLRAEGQYEDDLQTGWWTYWFLNGEKEMDGAFGDERRNGTWQYWYGTGARRAQGAFLDGRESGQWTYWSKTGERTQSGGYVRGRQHLRWTYWHDAERKKAEGYYLNGERVALWKFWDTSGNLTEKLYEIPPPYVLMREEWEPGVPRREGFLKNGTPHGLWVTRHRNGSPRMAGEFDSGVPVGAWMAWSEEGAPVASGRMESGRAVGEWIVWVDLERTTWVPEDIRPPGPGGAWSESSIVTEQSPDAVVETWLGEARSPLDSDAVSLNDVRQLAPAAAASAESGLAAAPAVPIKAQPEFTQAEKKKLDALEKMFKDGTVPGRRRRGGGGYSPPRRSSSSSSGGGKASAAIARNIQDKPLPETRFGTASGGRMDLNDLKGQKVVLVILRGFAGQVCVYCATQTRAYAQADAFDAFEKLNTKVLVMYPGPEEGLDAFREAYVRTFGGEELPPYEILYDPNLEFVSQIGIAGSLATPTTLVLDEQGIVRYVYVGKHIADRPAVKDVIGAVEGLSRNDG